MRVFLVGFMGAGKTTVGRLLADRLGLPFIDLDDQVEAAVGRSIPEIFEAEGEAWFREQEHAALESVLRQPAAVVATGGGLPAQARNLDLLQGAGAVVWLDVPFETLCHRLAGKEPSARPLFENPEGARQLFLARLPAYRQAEYRVSVSPQESAAAVAARIAGRLGGLSCAS